MAEQLGGKRSGFVGKIFMGPDFEAARNRLRDLFGQVRVLRPEGVRSNSFEVFLVGLDKRAGATLLADTEDTAGDDAPPPEADREDEPDEN